MKGVARGYCVVKSESLIDKSIRYFYGAAILCIVLLELSEMLQIICASLFVVFAAGLVLWIYKGKNINETKMLTTVSLLLFTYQIYMVLNIYPGGGKWDAGTIADAAKHVVYGAGNEQVDYRSYFSRYPNNLLMSFIFIDILKVDKSIGLLSKVYDGMLPLAVIQCAINTFTCMTVFKTARLFLKQKAAVSAYLFSLILVGVSPWSSLVYSDSISLAVPITCFYLYASDGENKRKKICKIALAIIIACVGYYIKPQCIIVLIAIGIYESTKLLKEPKRTWSFLLAVLLSIGTVVGTQKWIDFRCERMGIEIDPEMRLGATHFLMMGLNEGVGAYKEEDVVFSASIWPAEERQRANIYESVRRVKEYGVVGLIRHIGDKLRYVYGDGTFAWGHEGGFFKYASELPNANMSVFLRSIYYPSENRYELYKNSMQIIWAAVLVLNIISTLGKERKKEYVVLYIVIMGITLYEILFETRPRYLYIFAPIFCIIAASGLEVLSGAAREVADELIMYKKKANENS